MPRRQLLTPIAIRRGEIEHAAQPSGIDQILIGDPGSELIDAVIRIVDDDAQRLQVKGARGPEQLAQIFDRVLARRRELVGKRADGKCMRNVVNRTVPADAHMVGHGSILAAHIGNVVGHVDDALAEFVAAAVNDIRLECRLDRRGDGAMQPRIGTAVLVERCLEVLRANRVIIVVLD